MQIPNRNKKKNYNTKYNITKLMEIIVANK